MSKLLFTKLFRVALTLIFVVLALFAIKKIWVHYQVEPWTPDGRVKADIVQIAPDVAGTVTVLAVTHNQQVKRGQLLFQIDPSRYQLALREAQFELVAKRAALSQLQRESKRNKTLGELVATENQEQIATKIEEAQASLALTSTKLELAQLNLERTKIVAPVDGTLSDLKLREGNYVAIGMPVMALIDANSYSVEGYFEETKLQQISIGQVAQIKLMGSPTILHGHVQSIASGIEDRDRVSGANLLPNVNPTFSWVRLAQRIPVRITLDNPHDPTLIAGRTASVSLMESTQQSGRSK
jgi:RND family efflux transporter MFP subunit